MTLSAVEREFLFYCLIINYLQQESLGIARGFVRHYTRFRGRLSPLFIALFAAIEYIVAFLQLLLIILYLLCNKSKNR